MFICISFEARGRPGKTVQMTEAEVRCLCLKSRELFLSQPILLELEAPLKICGKFTIHMPVGNFSIHCWHNNLFLELYYSSKSGLKWFDSCKMAEFIIANIIAFNLTAHILSEPL